MERDPGIRQASREAFKLGIYIVVALIAILLSRSWWRAEIREVATEVFIEMKDSGDQ